MHALGEGTPLWTDGEQMSPNFFLDWQGRQSQTSFLVRALGGNQTDGVLSDYVVTDESILVAVEEHLSLTEVATLPCSGLTALHALFEREQLKLETHSFGTSA